MPRGGSGTTVHWGLFARAELLEAAKRSVKKKNCLHCTKKKIFSLYFHAPGECRSVGDDNNRCCVARSA